MRPSTIAWSLCATLLASVAQAQSWETIARGVRYRRATLPTSGARLETYAVEANLCAPGVRVRVTAPSERGQTTSAWARAVGAVAATNGDYFEGVEPTGPSRGNDAWWPAGPRVHHDALLASGRGRLPRIVPASLASPALWLDASTRVENGESEVLAAREQVLRDGSPQLSPQIPHDGGRHPRTALGFAADRHTLWLLVIDGRNEDGDGATVEQLSSALRALGASEGLKLDGGGSSTLYVRPNGVVNHPSDGRERVVANHFGVVIDPSSPLPAACATRASEMPRRGFPSGATLVLAALVGCAWAIGARGGRAPADTSAVSSRRRRA
jgi:hypothetical protein